MNNNAIIIMCGNCRTFTKCFESAYFNIIMQLFDNSYNIHLYLYLKLTDPGPKHQYGWNFKYDNIEYNELINKLNEFKSIYKLLNLEFKILNDNEINDNELLSQVKNRNLFNSNNLFGYSFDHVLLRGLHCHYNFEKCGQYILEKEKLINKEFNYIIYIRPDLFFTNKCNSIEKYNNDLITLGCNHLYYNNNDHLAIIPRKYLNMFFFGRMEIYRNNTDTIFSEPEQVYRYNIPYEIKDIGNYYVKRD
jgi:hypothetical protein